MKWSLKVHYNVLAFMDVIDKYNSLKTRSSVSVLDYDNSSASSPNKAKPNPSDFICDVENIILKTLDDKKLLQKFFQHYIIGGAVLDPEQLRFIENKLGQAFRKYKLSPVSRYFISIRKN